MKTILVTGASGAIGSALVPELLKQPDVEVRLLLRASDDQHLEQRAGELCAYWELRGAQRSRLAAFRGDVTRSRLGLAAASSAQLRREVTHLVHAAGNVNLNCSLAEARCCAANALSNVIEFCKSVPRLAKLEYLSTIGVAGRLPGLVPEEPLSRPREFHNTYEEAKAEAEDLLLDEIRCGLPATIHRPSMVVGDSRTGRIKSFQVFYHLAEFLSGRRTAGIIPFTGEHRLDLVPVDYVVGAILISMRRSDSVGRIFHLCSGPQDAPRLATLSTMIRALKSAEGLRLPRLRRVSVGWLRRLTALAGSVTPGRTGRALRSLPHFLTYLDEEQLFENARTREFFEPMGLRLPRLEDYLPPVMAYRAGSGLPVNA